MPKHILVAHDLSLEADIAVRRAAQLAREHDASVSLLHVIEETFPAPVLARVKEAADVALQESARNNRLEQCQRLIRQGRATAVIGASAETLRADLLVIGAHHRQFLESFDGTTLEQIIRTCQVPALLAIASDPHPYDRALCALDFSVGACNAWCAACAWLAPHAELLALHAYDAGRDADKTQARLDEQRALLEQLIRDESARVGGSLPHLQCRVSPAAIQTALDELINDWKPDLLVLGSRSRGALQQALLGSTARYYLRRPPCDLLISA